MEVTDLATVKVAAGRDRVAGGLVTGLPVGGVPVAVAESATEPWVRSAAVTV